MKIVFQFLICMYCTVMVSAADLCWEGSNSLSQWKAAYRIVCTPSDAGIKLTGIGRDAAIILAGQQINPQKINALEIKYRASGTRHTTHGQLYFSNSLGRFSDARRWNLPSLKGDGKWHTMLVTANELTDAAAWQNGGTVTSLRLDITDEPGGTIEISKIRLFHDPDLRPVKSAEQLLDGPVWPWTKPNFFPLSISKIKTSYFGGGMIAHPADNGRKGNFVLRKSFDLPSAPARAKLMFIADDSGALWINGRQALKTAGDWRRMNSADVTGLLKPGRNVIAIRYTNEGSAGGALADLQVLCTNGEYRKICSDDKFRAGTDGIAGWEQEIFDDSAWLPVVVMAPPPALPWDVKFDYIDISCPQKLISAVVAPEKVKAGDKAEIQIRLAGKIPALPTFIRLAGTKASGYALPDVIAELNKDNVRKLKSDEWEFRVSYPLSSLIGNTRITVKVEMAREIDRTPEVSFDCVGASPLSVKNIRTEVRQTAEGPRFFLEGEMVYPVIACVPRNSGPDPMDLDFRLLFPIGAWWVGDKQYDFTAFDLAVEQASEAYPNVKFFVQVDTYPPKEWAKRNPGEMAIDENGRHSRHFTETTHSFSSPIALADIRHAVETCVRYLEHSPYADRIAGYRIIGGHTAEWIGWGYMDKKIFDYSGPAQKAFLSYIAKSFPQLKLSRIPSNAELMARPVDGGNLLSPSDNLATIAYHYFYSQSITDMLIDLCRAARRACEGRKVIGSYYGYTINTTASPYFQVTGHYNLMELLKSGAVDFILSPQSYGIRHLGGTVGDMKPFQTLANHGVMSLIEDDTRTHALPPIRSNNYDQTITPEQSVGMMRRNLGIALCRQQPLQLYTFYGKYHSEFSFPEMKPLIRDLKRTGEFCWRNGVGRNADIALVVSEQSLNFLAYEKDYVRSGSRRQNFNHSGGVGNFPESFVRLAGGLISGQIDPIGRSGAVCDYILAEDIENHLDDYKLWVFTDCFNYDENFLNAVRKLRSRPNTLLWLYAPGYYHNLTANVENMEKLTGFRFEKLPSAPAEVKLTDGQYLGVQDDIMRPAFSVIPDSEVRVLGTYTGSNYVGFAEKQEGPSRSIFCGPYHFSASFYRNLARQSGAHIYLNSGDPTEANDALVLVHARWPGRKVVHLKKRCDVVDIFNKKVIARNVDRFEFEAPLHSSWLFYTGPNAGEFLKDLKREK